MKRLKGRRKIEFAIVASDLALSGKIEQLAGLLSNFLHTFSSHLNTYI
jgi:hypothetical protein